MDHALLGSSLSKWSSIEIQPCSFIHRVHFLFEITVIESINCRRNLLTFKVKNISIRLFPGEASWSLPQNKGPLHNTEAGRSSHAVSDFALPALGFRRQGRINYKDTSWVSVFLSLTKKEGIKEGGSSWFPNHLWGSRRLPLFPWPVECEGETE